MAYNPYNAINKIYNFKNQWANADAAGDETKKNEAAQKAQEYYNQLRNNGYTEVANKLSDSGLDAAKAINDKYYTRATANKTKTRPYLYTLGKKYGLSSGDIDNLISYDNISGQISFGGKAIGTPDTVVDGASYWSDTTALDNAFNDYIGRSGTTRSKAAAVNQENESLIKKYNREYEDLKNTNPFETDEAKSILAKYDLAGLQGRDNAAASGGALNSGNIDSYAAANAMRQQAALINQGQQTVLSAYQQKLDHAKSLLSEMGVNIDRVYNQDETSKNSDVARKSEIASVTGYTPAEWSIQNDEFLKNFVDDNGKLKAEYKDTDFQELIDNAKANGDTELANKYAILRGLKIFGNFAEYGKYLNSGDVAYAEPQKTESAREFDEQLIASKEALAAESAANAADNASKEKIAYANNASDEKIAYANIASKEKIAAADNQNNLDKIHLSAMYDNSKASKPALTASQAASAIKNGETSQAVIDAYNYYYGTNYTADNLPDVNGDGSLSTTGASTETAGGNDWDTFMSYFPEKLNDKDRTKVRNFLTEQLKPYYDNGWEINEETLENLIAGDNVMKSNSTIYDLDTHEVKTICRALGLDSSWVDKYKDRWGLNSGKGMKLAK